ncbi:MAG TPA: DUF3053 family protein [Pseudolabrys sp.]
MAIGLAACGDSEPDQRKAFIAFLQQVNQRTGVHILNPTADETKSFGDYAKHYAVIVNFSKDVGTIVEHDQQVMRKIGSPGARTIEQMAAHRDDLVAIDDMITTDQPAMEKRLAQADAERAALKQPDDLKAVYDKTYAKVVTAPAQAMLLSNKTMAEGLKASLKIADYVNAHRDKLVFNGAQIQAKDKQTLAEFSPLLSAHQEAARRFQEVQRNGQRLLDDN